MDSHSESIDPKSAEKTLIFQLPNEVLEEIFSHVFDLKDKDRESTRTRIRLVALSRTCQRFHPIVQHALYRNPCFWSPMLLDNRESSNRQIKAFHRRLKDSPALGSVCKRFCIRIDDRESLDINIANELLLSMPKLTHLSVMAYFNCSETWFTVRDAVHHMRSLQELALGEAGKWGFKSGPPLRGICRDINLPSFCVLKLHHSTTSFDLGLEDKFKGRYRGTKLVPDEKQGKAAFKSLHVSMPGPRDSYDLEKSWLDSGSDYLKDFLKWPKALESFTFTPTPGLYSLSGIQESLQPVYKTLKSLNLDSVSPSWSVPDAFNLEHFEKLESLSMDLKDLCWEEAEPYDQGSPELAAAGLCASKLCSLTLDFRKDYKGSWIQASFGDKKADWILTFAQHAKVDGSPLSDITLVLAPFTTWRKHLDARARGPVELLELFGTLDRVKSGCRKLGIEFHYSGPHEEEYRAE
ncbi:hypothetical protein MMC10_009334 [Thelotrema lepadinum]|nr:hypothetical protein [Thelotrema lepadinum]